MSEIDNIETIASELMDAGKYDAATLYWQKAIDSGLLNAGQEDGALKRLNECRYKMANPDRNHPSTDAIDSRYYLQDELEYNAISKYENDDFENTLNKISKTPDCSELNYADQLAVKNTIEILSSELNNMSSDETYYTEMIERTLGNLAQKGYPSAQGQLAKRFEEKGDYLKARRYYDMLSDNDNVSPLWQDYYSEKSTQMSDLKNGKEPRPLTVFDKRDNDINNHKEPDRISEPLATEIIASELMDAGKYDAAAMYWQKAIDTGLSNAGDEDWQLDFMEKCQYCHEKGCEWREIGEHVNNSQYYNPDGVRFGFDEEISQSLDNLGKVPDIDSLNYADRKAIKETIGSLTENLDFYDEKTMQRAEQILAGLSVKGYPNAQSFMAKRLEKRGEYASAQAHYNRLADNNHISPLWQEHYSEKTGQMKDLRAGKEPRPLTALDKRHQKIDDMKPKQEPPKKSLSDRLAEYGQRVDRAAGNVIENLPLALLRASAQVAKAGVQLTGTVLDSGVKLAGAFVNAPELGIGRGLESSLSKGLNKVINWTTKMMSDKKGGR